MITNEYRDKVLADIKKTGISLELFQEKVKGAPWPDRDHTSEIVRLFIISHPLGGTLAVNHGDGWLPVFPERQNYPVTGNWYSPDPRHYPEKQQWCDAVIDAIMPERIIPKLDPMGNRVAMERAQKLRHPLKAAVAIAVLRKYKEEVKL